MYPLCSSATLICDSFLRHSFMGKITVLVWGLFVSGHYPKNLESDQRKCEWLLPLVRVRAECGGQK